MATVRASRAAAPHLRAARGCSVNVSSISGFRPSLRTPAYAAVKALLVNYTQSQAAAFAKDPGDSAGTTIGKNVSHGSLLGFGPAGASSAPAT
jgi:NAD(P)-dependent dehydrogenase (short-subunit alcohol dehydrogenase family)